MLYNKYKLIGNKKGEIDLFIQRQLQEGQMALQGAIGHPLSEACMKKNS